MKIYENQFLGVLIDHKLCCKPRVKYLCCIGVLSKSRYILNQKTLHILYSAITLPY